jgi:hypothetical protein
MINKSKDEIVKEGLFAYISQFPNSIVGDLLTHFYTKKSWKPQEIILQFLTLYGGRQLDIPKVDSIWRSYRDKVVIDTLLVKNTKVARQQLAEYFGVSSNLIYGICYRNKQQGVYLSNKSISKIVETVYRHNIEIFHKEMKKLFSEKYGIEYFSIHDERQNPEDQYLIKEALEKLKERCEKGIKQHSVFIGREYKIDYGIALIMKKIDENL